MTETISYVTQLFLDDVWFVVGVLVIVGLIFFMDWYFGMRYA